MASRSTVLLKPFASKRCFLVCQQNLVVELYYGSTKDVENLVAFPKATVKLKTVKVEASIENVTILFNFVQRWAVVSLWLYCLSRRLKAQKKGKRFFY